MPSSTGPGQRRRHLTWDYEKGARPALDKLYEKAKKSQWNSQGRTSTGPPTSTRSSSASMAGSAPAKPAAATSTCDGTCFANWGDDDWVRLGIEMQNWTLSQFMHGEQGALICTAKIVETVPWIDAKYYRLDAGDGQARHVEVFARPRRT
ncbi:MAG: hypothetical protein R2699_10280 [Acidimicrobiales bacterium]